MIAGHTHRIANTVVGHIPVVEGVNAGGSYSVAQLMVKGGGRRLGRRGDARGQEHRRQRRGPTSRRSSTQANAETAAQRNKVIGTQQSTSGAIRRACSESAMGNMVADAMRAEVPGRGRRDHELRRACARTSSPRPPTAGEQPGEITWGEVFAVLPFGNGTVIETLTGAQLAAGDAQRRSARCATRAVATGRFPQVSGLKVDVPLQRPDAGHRRDLEGAERAGRDRSRRSASDTVRFVTNDFMFTGGDGYTVFAAGTNVQQPGDALLDVAIDYIAANSPVAPVVEGRVVRH